MESLSASLKSKPTLLEKNWWWKFYLIKNVEVEGEVIEWEEIETDIQWIILKLDS